MIGDPHMTADIVPVDFVVNGTLLSAMKTAVDHKRKGEHQWEDHSDSGNSTDIGKRT